MAMSMGSIRSVAAVVAIAGCSRVGSGSARDTSTVSADSVTSATIGKPGSSPSGEATRPAAPTSAPRPGPTTAAKTIPPPPKSGTVAVSPTVDGTRPHLTKLTPTSGSIGRGDIISVQVAGERMTAAGNTIYFGSTALGDVASSDGRTLRFVVPQTIPSRSEVPPMPVQAGRYAVYIVNARGTSDTLFFTITGFQF